MRSARAGKGAGHEKMAAAASGLKAAASGARQAIRGKLGGGLSNKLRGLGANRAKTAPATSTVDGAVLASVDEPQLEERR